MGSFSILNIADPQTILDVELEEMKGQSVSYRDAVVMNACHDNPLMAEMELKRWAQRHDGESAHHGVDCWIVSMDPFTIKIGNGGKR